MQRIDEMAHATENEIHYYKQIEQLTRDLAEAKAENGELRFLYNSARNYKRDLAEAKIEIERLANWGTLARENERLTEALRRISDAKSYHTVGECSDWAREALAAKGVISG